MADTTYIQSVISGDAIKSIKNPKLLKAYKDEIARISASDLIGETQKKQALKALKSAVKEISSAKVPSDSIIYFPEPFVFAQSKKTEMTPGLIAEYYIKRMGLSSSLHHTLENIFSPRGVKKKVEDNNLYRYNIDKQDLADIEAFLDDKEHGKVVYTKNHFKDPDIPITRNGEFYFGPDEFIGIDPMAKLEIANARMARITQAVNSAVEAYINQPNFPLSLEAKYGPDKFDECEQLFASVTKGEIFKFLADKQITVDQQGLDAAFALFMGVNPSTQEYEQRKIMKSLEKPMEKFAKDKTIAAFRETFASSMAQEYCGQITRELSIGILHAQQSRDNAFARINDLKKIYPDVVSYIDAYLTEKDPSKLKDHIDHIMFVVGDQTKDWALLALSNGRSATQNPLVVEVPEFSVRSLKTPFGEINLEEVLGKKEADKLQEKLDKQIKEATRGADEVVQKGKIREDKTETMINEQEAMENLTKIIGRGNEDIVYLNPEIYNDLNYNAYNGILRGDVFARDLGNGLMDIGGKIFDSTGKEYYSDENGVIFGQDGQIYGQVPAITTPQESQEDTSNNTNEDNNSKEVA